MSVYTMELRHAVNNVLFQRGIDITGYPETLEQYWPLAYGYIGLADYPIFDEAYRQTLNNDIIRYYYMREIGCETLEQFAFRVRGHMMRMMPYYNDLYRAKISAFAQDHMWSTGEVSWTETRDHHETGSRTTADDTATSDTQQRSETVDRDTTGTSSNVNDNTAESANLELPMGSLGSSNDVFASGEYATSRDKSSSHGTSAATTGGSEDVATAVSENKNGTVDRDISESSARDYGETITHDTVDRREPVFDMFARFAAELIDIDDMIVQSLEPFFMGVY